MWYIISRITIIVIILQSQIIYKSLGASKLKVLNGKAKMKNQLIICAWRRFTLKSESSHHFFRNAYAKSGSLRFSQLSGCWLILSVYILMSSVILLLPLLMLMNFNVLMLNDLDYFPPKTPYFDTTMWFTRLAHPYIAYKYFEIKAWRMY